MAGMTGDSVRNSNNICLKCIFCEANLQNASHNLVRGVGTGYCHGRPERKEGGVGWKWWQA